jgi:hypothetical protein
MPTNKPKAMATRGSIRNQNTNNIENTSSAAPTQSSSLTHKSKQTHPHAIEQLSSQPSSSPSSPSASSNMTTPEPTTSPSSNPTSPKHKAINSKSTNRRQCKRASDDLSISTPVQNNLSQRKHAFSTRLTLKMKCPASENAEEMLINIIHQFIGELISADSTSAILPWKAIHRSKRHITKAAEVPNNTRQLRTYLNKFYISRTPNATFVTYPGIHIGHNKTLPEIREEMQLWLQEGEHGLYYKMLQVEDSADIGWLLYSTKEMDAGALADEIEDLVRVKVGLRWKIIDVGTKGKLPETQRVRALCVEVNSRFRWEAQRKFISYFSRNLKNLKEYPNGIRLRFVKNKKDAINSAEKGKIEKLRARQKSFLSNIVSSKTWDIVQLDYSAQSKEPTLRQMIMSLKTSNDIPLFHCVDLDWRGEGHVFQFSPEVKVEAEYTINTLLPILKHQFPDIEVDKHFTHETNDQFEGRIFDPDKGVVVDSLVNDHLVLINEKNLLGHPELVELIILGLNIWHKNDRFPLTYKTLEPDLLKAWTQQRSLGWTSFIEGLWTLEWLSFQEQYLQHINSQKSSILWISRAQRRIWLIAWNLWELHNNFYIMTEKKQFILFMKES